MNTSEIQARIDTMPAALNAKGLREPKARFSINGNEPAEVWLSWRAVKKDVWGSDSRFEWVKGDTPDEMLAKADAFIASLPSPEAARREEFLDALGAVIELGRANGIDVQFVNPLTEAMKRLSENAITFQRAA